ncbi:hypothetical protein QAD02_000830 [Eretmocerus hayati]|uniref:Uncharacterized protein n=1 Tax=Eretmocerus hayati TaxID=131215 RepID=A0ACC2NFA2_9HYME|nr:hypothetical protein QAD02_000830 [Eretmocerus hayati]
MELPLQQPNVTSRAILKVRLWLSGAPGGFWPEEDEIATPSPSSKATIADSESTAGILMDEEAWPFRDSGRSSRLSLQEDAPQSIRLRTTASPADAAKLQHVHECQPARNETLIRPPHGCTPRPDLFLKHRDVSPSYAASLSQALLKIRIQYASSEEEDTPVSAGKRAASRNSERAEDSSTSAYSSGGGNEEEEGPAEDKSARARGPSFPLRHRRRSRAERAARNAAWRWSVTEQSHSYNYTPTVDISSRVCAPIRDQYSAPKVVFQAPLFFVYPPSAADMPVVPEEVYALAKNYWENECNETELLMVDYIKTHRALRQGRERAAACKKRKEEQEYRALKKLFRQKRVRDERESELVSLGAPTPPPAAKPSKAAKSKGKNPFFLTANKKRGPRRTLGALKDRLALTLATRAEPRVTPPEQRPTGGASLDQLAAPGQRPSGDIVNAAAMATTPRRLSELQEELSSHIVLHTAAHSTATPVYPATFSPGEAVVYQEADENVDMLNTGDPMVSPLTYEGAREYFAPLYEDAEISEYVSEQPPLQLNESVTSAIADSTTAPTHRAATVAANMYEFPQPQVSGTSDYLVNPFRALEDVAPMDGAPAAMSVSASIDDPETPRHDDEFWALLLDDAAEARPTMRMRFTRRPGVSSTITSRDDVEDAETSRSITDVDQMYTH